MGQFTEAEQKILYESEDLGLRIAAMIVRDWLNPKPKKETVKSKPKTLPQDKPIKAQQPQSLGKRDEAQTEPGAPPVKQKQNPQKSEPPAEEANPRLDVQPTETPN